MLGRVKGAIEGFVKSAGRYLPRNPNILTLLGLASSILAPPSALMGLNQAVPILIALAGLFDMLDGLAARYHGTATRAGAFIDSSLDRFSDALLIASIALMGGVDVVKLAEAYASLAGALLTSYARARAESLGFSMAGLGLFERPERLLYMLALSIIYVAVGNGEVLVIGLGVFSALTLATAVQRTIEGYRALATHH